MDTKVETSSGLGSDMVGDELVGNALVMMEGLSQ